MEMIVMAQLQELMNIAQVCLRGELPKEISMTKTCQRFYSWDSEGVYTIAKFLSASLAY